MTPEEKIAALVEHIKKEFPGGCEDVRCEDCSLYGSKSTTIRAEVCSMMIRIRTKADMGKTID